MTKRLIILEGADGVGKTTAAGDIAKIIPGRSATLHFNAPVNTNLHDEYIMPVEPLARCGFTVIADRFHLGEHIWPYLFKREPIAITTDFDDFEADLKQRFDRIVVLHIDANPLWVESVLRRRGEDEQAQAHAVAALHMFRYVMAKVTTLEHITCTRHNAREVAREWMAV